MWFLKSLYMFIKGVPGYLSVNFSYATSCLIDLGTEV